MLSSLWLSVSSGWDEDIGYEGRVGGSDMHDSGDLGLLDIGKMDSDSVLHTDISIPDALEVWWIFW